MRGVLGPPGGSGPFPSRRLLQTHAPVVGQRCFDVGACSLSFLGAQAFRRACGAAAQLPFERPAESQGVLLVVDYEGLELVECRRRPDREAVPPRKLKEHPLGRVRRCCRKVAEVQDNARKLENRVTPSDKEPVVNQSWLAKEIRQRQGLRVDAR